MISSMFRTPARLSILEMMFEPCGADDRMRATSSAFAGEREGVVARPRVGRRARSPRCPSATAPAGRAAGRWSRPCWSARARRSSPPPARGARMRPSRERPHRRNRSRARSPTVSASKSDSGHNVTAETDPLTGSAESRISLPSTRTTPSATSPHRTWAPSVSRQIGVDEHACTSSIEDSTRSSGVCERLIRNRSTSRASSSRMISGSMEAGPSVQRIWIFNVRPPGRAVAFTISVAIRS